MTTTRPSVTVAILTYNGEQYLGRILQSLATQRYEGAFEILVIDSGSSDGTLATVAAHPEVRLVAIPNGEFGHGKTRNLAAALATTDLIAYLTHDAVPAHDRWLAELVAPFDIDDRVVAVMGKQVPRPGAFPLQRYEIEGLFAGLGPDFGVTLFGADLTAADSDARAFYSDVNSAARRSLLVGELPYRDVRYAEDQLFGRDVIAAGFWKAYAPGGAVEHSNDLDRREYRQRIFDETVGLREIGTAIPVLRRRNQLNLTLRGILGDTLRIARDRRMSTARRLYWWAVNPSFHLAKWSAYRRATLVDLADRTAIEAGSLEHSRKRG